MIYLLMKVRLREAENEDTVKRLKEKVCYAAYFIFQRGLVVIEMS